MTAGGIGKLAAVVLNYRTPYDTVLAVRSLQSSSRPPDDVLVVDNASGDESLAVFARHLHGCEIEPSTVNRGFSGGCNLGINRALDRGADSVLLVNGDLMFGKRAVERLMRAIAASGVGIAGALLLNRSDPSRIDAAGLRFNTLTGRMRVRLAGRRVVPGITEGAGQLAAVMGCAMLISREVFDRVGMFDEDYFFSFEDLDLCLRARHAGFAIVLVGDALAYHAGALSIGPRSPVRHYYATRNHLLLARRAAPLAWPMAQFRAGLIFLLNFAHAFGGGSRPRVAALSAWSRGAWHHLRRRYGVMPP